jgi:hypothetical protein
VLVSQHQSVIAQALHNTVTDFPEREYTKVDSSKHSVKKGVTDWFVYKLHVVQFIQLNDSEGGPKVGMQYTASQSTFFVLYLSSLPSFTIPVKKKKNYCIPTFGPPCILCSA